MEILNDETNENKLEILIEKILDKKLAFTDHCKDLRLRRDEVI